MLIGTICRYVDYLLAALRGRELFTFLVCKPRTFWHTLLFRDRYNYLGIEAAVPEVVMQNLLNNPGALNQASAHLAGGAVHPAGPRLLPRPLETPRGAPDGLCVSEFMTFMLTVPCIAKKEKLCLQTCCCADMAAEQDCPDILAQNLQAVLLMLPAFLTK